MHDFARALVPCVLLTALAACSGGGGSSSDGGGDAGGGGGGAGAGNACTVDGETFESGSAFFAFPSAEVLEPEVCTLEQYQCNDGVVTDADDGTTVDAATLANDCVARAPATCPTGDFEVLHNEVTFVFSETNPTFETACSSIALEVTCTDGTLIAVGGDVIDGTQFFRNCTDAVIPLSEVVAALQAEGLVVISDAYVIEVEVETGTNTITGVLYRAPTTNADIADDDPNQVHGFLAYGTDPTVPQLQFGTQRLAPTGRLGNLDLAISYFEAVFSFTRDTVQTYANGRAEAQYAPVLEARTGTTIERSTTPGSEFIRVATGQPDRFTFFHPEPGTLSASCQFRIDEDVTFPAGAPDLVAGTNSFTLDAIGNALSQSATTLADAGINPGDTLPLECSVATPGAQASTVEGDVNESFIGVVMDITYTCEGPNC